MKDETRGAAAAAPTCRCGYDRHHVMVSAEGRYGWLGWVTLLMGITTVPRRLVFRCRVCGDVVEEVDDPQELRDFV